MNSRIIARRRDADQAEQPLSQHLQEAACLCASFAQKIRAEEAGRLLGLLHDFGKYSQEFQKYLTVNAASKRRGEVDHSTAGAQLLWQHLNGYGKESCLISQMLSLCLVSHHGGPIDCLKPDNGENSFQNRICKSALRGRTKRLRLLCLGQMMRQRSVFYAPSGLALLRQ